MASYASDRERAVAWAIRLSAFTIAWNLVFGIAAVIVATATGSSSLVGFGLDAVVDAAASIVLVWRFREERVDEERAPRIEGLVRRVVGISLVSAGTYVSVRSILSLANNSGPESSTFGLVLAAASAVVLPFLATAKVRVASRLGSKALRADGILTAAAG